jgi:anthranilate synthase component 1
MLRPDLKTFLKLSEQGNLIPVYKEIVADLETPVSAYKKIEAKNSFLLESVEGGEKIARYSFLGADPLLVITTKNQQITITENGKKKKLTGNPIDILKKLLSQYKCVHVEGLPRFQGGLVGYFGYDVVRFFENIPDKNPDELKLPDSTFFLADSLLAFDHVKHKILIIANAHVKDDPKKAYLEAQKKIAALEKKLKKTLPLKTAEFELNEVPENISAKSNLSKEQFKSAVEKAKKQIVDGDIIQVVLSQRLNAPIKRPPFDIYRLLRILNPSPYMFYLNFGDYKLLGSSPEVMCRVENNQAIIRPIAGTRRRGNSETEDQNLAQELKTDQKEVAEHVMLVDLARNDLGRVCVPGTVKVTENMAIERYSQVMHLVSNVVGQLKQGEDQFSTLAATFPAGTVSGAPKIRAMQIIDEMENTKRGPYAGVVGYFGFSGDLDSCITIRTILIKGKQAFVQAGAGIVADSIPEKEYEETLNKAKALLKALYA